MKTLVIFLAMVSVAIAEPAFIPSGRILIFGDSITDAHLYNAYLESALRGQYPTNSFRVYESARGGSQMMAGQSSNAGYLDRWDVGGICWQANYVMISGAIPGNQSSNVFHANLLTFTEKVRNTNDALPIMLGLIPGDSCSPVFPPERNFSHMTIAAATNYPFVNTWEDLVGSASYYGWSNNCVDGHPYDLGWADGTHPGAGGHVQMAFVAYKGLGFSPFISGAQIDASGNTATWQSNCTISALSMTATGGTFTRLDTKLPMAWDTNAQDGISMRREIVTNYNLMPLIVSNLNAGTYTVSIDGTAVTNVSHTILGTVGINIADIYSGSYQTQRLEVLGRIRDKMGVDRVSREDKFPNSGFVDFGSSAGASYNAGNRGDALIADLADELAEVDALDDLVIAAAQPIARNFTIAEAGAPAAIGASTNSVSGNIVISGNVSIQ